MMKRTRKLRAGMIRTSLITVSFIALAGMGSVPKHTHSGIDYDAETAAITQDYIQMVRVNGDIAGTQRKYLTEDFIEHNPEIPNGLGGDQKMFAARQKAHPEKYLDIKQWHSETLHVLVQGKLFALHSRLRTNPNDPGRMFVDIYRVEDGKIVEHWDVIQDVPTTAQNNNTMWSDLAPPKPQIKDAPAPESVVRAYLALAEDAHDPISAVEKYVNPDFRQHDPNIADGKAALIAYFKQQMSGMTPEQLAAMHTGISHILSQDDLVLVHRHVRRGPDDPGVMHADLYRVQDGLIVEGWTDTQDVPKTTVENTPIW